MTDKELLEQAAKAIGLNYLQYVKEDYPNRAGLLHGNPNGRLFVWNPLEDDREAFRLLVRLDIALVPQLQRGFIETRGPNFTEQAGNDPYAAARRVIVRAADKEGEVMANAPLQPPRSGDSEAEPPVGRSAASGC